MTEQTMNLDRLTGKPVLTGLRLQNFKGANIEGIEVPLRPLTVVYGPNSGGKSTILKAIASLAQTRINNAQSGDEPNWWESNGIWFDLGPRNHVIHRPSGKGQQFFNMGFQFDDISSRIPWVGKDNLRIARMRDPLSCDDHKRIHGHPQKQTYVSRFSLPEKLPKNHFIIFHPERDLNSGKYLKKEIPIFVSHDSDFTLKNLFQIKNWNDRNQYTPDSDVEIIETRLIHHEDRDGLEQIEVTYSVPDLGDDVHTGQISSEEPGISVLQLKKISSEINLSFRYRGRNTDQPILDKVVYSEERDGIFQPIMTMKRDSLPIHSAKHFGNDEEVFLTRFHTASSITGQGETEYDQWAKEDFSAVQTLAGVFLPLKYSMKFDRAAGQLSLRNRRDEDGGRLSIHFAFWKDLNKLMEANPDTTEEGDNQKLLSCIDLINGYNNRLGLAPMTKKAERALKTFLLPQTKQVKNKGFSTENKVTHRKPPVFLDRILDITFPKKGHTDSAENYEIGVEKQEWTERPNDEVGTKSDYIQHFGIENRYLQPWFQIKPNLSTTNTESLGLLHTFGKGTFGNLPTVCRSQFNRFVMSFVEQLDQIRATSRRIDYLTASRLNPKRLYTPDQRATIGVGGQRSIANLFGRFPKGSAKLKELNQKMNRVVGMGVEFHELKSRGQSSGIIDVRVGRPGKPKMAQLPDVGFGVSQTLPVLAAVTEVDFSDASASCPLLIIEEAESNLHPSAQSKLMQEILDNLPLVDGPSMVIETHSEHFLKTILNHLSEESDLTDDDIAIVYVDEDEEGMFASHMETLNGEFLQPWPRPGRWDDPTSPII